MDDIIVSVGLASIRYKIYDIIYLRGWLYMGHPLQIQDGFPSGQQSCLLTSIFPWIQLHRFLHPTCLISDMIQAFQIQFHSKKILKWKYRGFRIKKILTREARRFFRVRFSPPPPLASAGLSRANLARISSGNLISVGSDNLLIASCLNHN